MSSMIHAAIGRSRAVITLLVFLFIGGLAAYGVYRWQCWLASTICSLKIVQLTRL